MIHWWHWLIGLVLMFFATPIVLMSGGMDFGSALKSMLTALVMWVGFAGLFLGWLIFH